MSIAHVELRDLFLNLVDESLSIVDIEFAVDMRDMRFDGAIGQAEYLANIRTASALSQKEEYLAFAGGKIVPLRDFQMVFRQGFADALLYRGFVALCWLACACRTIALKLRCAFARLQRERALDFHGARAHGTYGGYHHEEDGYGHQDSDIDMSFLNEEQPWYSD